MEQKSRLCQSIERLDNLEEQGPLGEQLFTERKKLQGGTGRFNSERTKILAAEDEN